MKNITVFCSAVNVEEKYTEAARTLAHLIGTNGFNLVWGGSDVGLMKVISDSAKEAGAKLIGVSMPRFASVMKQNADEKIMAADLGDRKKQLLERGDAIIAITGGIGTLDEVMEIIELKKQGQHKKPVVIVNTDHFYEGLKLQLETMYTGGFFPMAMEELVHFVQTPEEAIAYLLTLA
jgi:uncharacterized protein (TIGR00730 family)